MPISQATAASFVPAFVIHRLADATAPVVGPEGTSFEAASFFADVSGFTQLAGRLAEQGPAGAEELTRILNAYFSELIELITAHGGEAVESAGDALLALWPVAINRGETLANAVRRAAGCALAVQATLDGYDVGGGLTLSLHIGIGAGAVQALLIGGVGEAAPWYPLIAGNAIRQMGIAEGQAASGDVVLSAVAWRLVADQCAGDPHEDDSARCVLAALAIRRALAAIGQRSAMGITTGRAFAGPVGSDVRREYTVVGDVMNMAARLMGKADGGVLCDEATARATDASGRRHRVTMEALPPVLVKGRIAPLLVFRPAAAQPSPQRPRPEATNTNSLLVGRLPEQSVIAAALAAVQSGTSGVLVIEGEAGLGKSRLVAHLASAAEAQHLRVLSGTADAVEQSTPYYAWRSVLDQLFDMAAVAETDPEMRRAMLLAQLGDNLALQEETPLLNPLLRIDLQETALTRAMVGEARAYSTGRLVVRLLSRWLHGTADADLEEGAGRVRPLVLILEDGHWLDSNSWALAQQVAREVALLLLVLATRPMLSPSPDAYVRLLELAGTHRLELSGLAPEDITALVCARLGVGTACHSPRGPYHGTGGRQPVLQRRARLRAARCGTLAPHAKQRRTDAACRRTDPDGLSGHGPGRRHQPHRPTLVSTATDAESRVRDRPHLCAQDPLRRAPDQRRCPVVA